MIYLSVQPDTPFFHWQIEVFITNFKSVGINPNKIEVVVMINESTSHQALALQQKYNTVRFFFYKDDRPDKSYIPSLKPYGVFKHLQVFPNLNNEPIFYHDSDIIFREKINEYLFDKDKIWYMSDTISYIGYEYCISKGISQFLDMIDEVKISRDDVRINQLNSGGAQYIIKETRSSFWYKVYEDSVYLYNIMCSYNEKDKTIANPIQKWCAEMWATVWNAWLFKYTTCVHSELDFSFATDSLGNWERKKILHNAGVTVDMKDLFFKGGYISASPIEEDLSYVNKNICSYKYVEAIKLLSTTVVTNQ